MATITVKTKATKERKAPDALILAGLQAPARTVPSAKKVASKRGARRDKYGRYPE